MAEALEYSLARSLVEVFRVLPAPLARGAGASLGGAARSFGFREEVVSEQIAAAFPEHGEDWVAEVSARCYRHFGREAAEIVRLQRVGTEEIARRTASEGPTEDWIEAMAAGRSTLVVTGHLGNWEVAGALLAARGVPLAAVVKRQDNPRFDRWLAGSRRRLGIEPVYMDEARQRIPGLLRDGRSVALVADQDARGRGLHVPFLGRMASTFRGPARLAIETGAPLVFGAALRTEDGYRALVDPVRPGRTPRPPAAGRGPDPDELNITRAWVASLEREVRAHPEQYFWFHRRWKSAGGPAGDLAAASPGRNEHGPPAVPHGDDGGPETDAPANRRPERNS